MDKTSALAWAGIGFHEVMVGREVAKNVSLAQSSISCILSEWPASCRNPFLSDHGPWSESPTVAPHLEEALLVEGVITLSHEHEHCPVQP